MSTIHEAPTTLRRPCRECGRTLTATTRREAGTGEVIGPELWLCLGHTPQTHARHARTANPDPVKCERCRLYVNPDAHDEVTCDEEVAEQRKDRAVANAEG